MMKKIYTFILFVLFVFGIQNAIGQNSSLLNGLISYYSFDYQGSFPDAHGYNNGIINGAIFNSNGILNGCYSFDGSNDFISIPGLDSFNENEFTFSVWIFKSLTSNKIASVLNTKAGQIWYDNKNFRELMLRAIDSRNGTGNTHLLQEYSLSNNEWHHIVFTANGNSLEGYIDGINTSLYMNYTTESIQGTYNLAEIGADGNTNYGRQRFWNGKIDELGFWDRVLTANEIMELYNNGVGKPYPFFGVSSGPLYSADKISIYPNPTKDMFYLGHINDINKITKYEIYGMNGKLMLENSINNSSTLINASNFPSGIYTILIKNHEGEIYTTKKLVIIQ
jgi:hypothetical protein